MKSFLHQRVAKLLAIATAANSLWLFAGVASPPFILPPYNPPPPPGAEVIYIEVTFPDRLAPICN